LILILNSKFQIQNSYCMFELLQIIIKSLGGFLFSLWWLWLPFFLFVLLQDLWLKYSREKFVQNMKWILLEVRPPKEMKRDPRTMEYVFAGLHGFHHTINFKERNFLGNVQEWFSFEIVSLGGEIHFYVRTLEKFRNQVEAQIYAQHPQAEIFEADDYTQFVPQDIPNKDYDLWGTDMILTKDDAYPIRTYPVFRKDTLVLEEAIDPIASLAEVLSKLQSGEQVWVQTLCKPIIEEKWEKKAEMVKNKLIGRKIERKPSLIEEEIVGLAQASKDKTEQFFTGKYPEEKKDEKKPTPAFITLLSQSEKDVVTAVEQKKAKIYYETVIRFLYLGRKEVFDKNYASAIVGNYKQFSTQDINGIKPNSKTMTRIAYKIQLKESREFYRKKKILAQYKKRYFPIYSPIMAHFQPFLYERLPILNRFFLKTKPFVFNIEELASVYHYPGEMVKAPTLPRVEAKKSEPPMGLPVG